jgi:hypothetical protein
MDKKQINKLKPGDEILIRGRFEKIKENGDYSISYLLTTVHGKLYMYKAAVHPSAVIIKSPPKYDPTRPFKEGDIVKPRFVDGRTDIDLSSLHPYTVTKREGLWGNVRVTNDNHSITTKAVFLELVTPVEEIELYSICPANTNVLFKCGKKIATFDDDDEAQELCDRLNAEWRKEQNNG